MLKLILSLCLIFTHVSSEEYFLTLRNEKVNLRLGPSFDHPVKIIYKKNIYLLLSKINPIILEKFRIMKIILDGYIYHNYRKKKAGITTTEMLLYKRPTIYSKPLANVLKGRLVLISNCKNDWCKVKSGKFSGWLRKKNIWGKT